MKAFLKSIDLIGYSVRLAGAANNADEVARQIGQRRFQRRSRFLLFDFFGRSLARYRQLWQAGSPQSLF
jgi:hypothetical protein